MSGANQNDAGSCAVSQARRQSVAMNVRNPAMTHTMPAFRIAGADADARRSERMPMTTTAAVTAALHAINRYRSERSGGCGRSESARTVPNAMPPPAAGSVEIQKRRSECTRAAPRYTNAYPASARPAAATHQGRRAGTTTGTPDATTMIGRFIQPARKKPSAQLRSAARRRPLVVRRDSRNVTQATRATAAMPPAEEMNSAG